jgi:hypothetical protein
MSHPTESARAKALSGIQLKQENFMPGGKFTGFHYLRTRRNYSFNFGTNWNFLCRCLRVNFNLKAMP